MGFYKDGELSDAGKVGTGYDEETLKTLHDKMEKLKREKPPFNEEVNYKQATWLEPNLVGEFEFSEWTDDNKLRHPSFLGLRDDKNPQDVIKEESG